ncbi:MAG: tRNA pseudouridine(55) synthase TruB [Rhodospirillaceae bacterium]|nr:tRNA pseudouridine(55) synthase TruB [Rhodospirillaceae bacterium]MBT6139370.1 tRNA pseudouridine(55) synthase TruB [Rhodospirillaceae bacterium]
MARRKRGNPVNGWVIVDKPSDITSTQVVGIVRRVFDAAKAGHAGTLDPIATGILPVALGEATKTIPYVMDATKDYWFDLRWGEARTTDDIEGDVTETSDLRPEQAEIEAALGAFLGELVQVPPQFSAVKIDGQRAYDLARDGETFEIKSRVVNVERFDLAEVVDRDTARFRVRSGKGTYMRSLARDLALALGTVGHVSGLRRLRVGPFDENMAISLDSLKAMTHSPAAFEHLMPVETALDDIPALDLEEAEANMLRRGQAVPVFRAADRERLGGLREGDVLYTVHDGLPVAISRIKGGCVWPIRVLNL